MPAGDAFVRNSQTEQQTPTGEILQGRRLDSQSHRATTIDVIDGCPQFDFLSPARNRGQHYDGVGAVRLAFPKSSEADLLGQFNQARHIGSRIVRRRIDLNVVDHSLVLCTCSCYRAQDVNKIRNSNIEIRNKSQTNKAQTGKIENNEPESCLEFCLFWSFEIVSNFGFRVSYFSWCLCARDSFFQS